MPLTPRDAVAILLGVGGAASGNPTGINTFMQREQQAQALARQQEMDRRAAEMQQAQLANLQADNAARDRQMADAAAQRRISFLGTLPNFLGDEEIDSPDLFNSRLTMAQEMGRQIGVEPAYIAKSFAVTPDKFTQRKAAKVVKRIEGDKRFSQALAHPDFQGQIFTAEDGTQKTYSEWKALAGQGGPAAGSPPLPVKQQSEAPLDRQALDALESGNTEAYKRILQVKGDIDRATRDPRDPVLAELARIRLEQTRNAPQLPPATQRRVDSKSKAFDSLPVVKTVQKQAEAVSFANALNPNTTNPADDQALIYAFAKAMDPDSVVREGEYATVQKYAQSWAESFGFNAKRIFSNTAFLTPQARQNMKTTIQKRYSAGRAQYDNVRKSYVSQINKITGQGDGESYLTDYGGAFPEGEPNQNTGREFMHPLLGRVRVVGTNPDGTLQVEKVVP